MPCLYSPQRWYDTPQPETAANANSAEHAPALESFAQHEAQPAYYTAAVWKATGPQELRQHKPPETSLKWWTTRAPNMHTYYCILKHTPCQSGGVVRPSY